MAYKPTGRRPGRPKTKEYETLTARIPQDIADQAREYAKNHRQTLSDVLRDGLYVILDEDRYKPKANIMSDIKAFSETETQEIASDTKRLSEEIVSDVKVRSEIEASYNVSDMKEGVSTLEQFPFDTSKFVLGKLCGNQHEYHNTGKTLRRLPKFVCPECDKEAARVRRSTKQQVRG